MPSNCKSCDQPIRGTTVTFEKEPYHQECFVCSDCREPLSGKQIYKQDGKEVCGECYAQNHAKKCEKCHQPLTSTSEKWVVYDDKHFHNSCFTCNGGCNESLAGQQFYIKGDQKICEKCH